MLVSARGVIMASPLLPFLLAGCLVNTELYEELSEQLQETEPVDLDGDGYPASADCDDSDDAIHPGAAELCNGVDDDCDDTVDEDAEDALSWYLDGDGDGHGAGEALAACEAPSGYVESSDDCHDDDATAYPGSTAPEISGDGVDQNCDGIDGCDDLNCDGWPDVVIASQRSGSDDYSSASSLWFGGEDGLGASPAQTLPSLGAVKAVVADFERDGWLDLALVGYSYGGSGELDAQLYQGGEDGLDADRFQTLPTTSALDAAAADLNQDGFPELIVCSGTVDVGESRVYWGSGAGLDAGAHTELPSSGVYRLVVSDLDSDGWEDLVFVSYVSSRGFTTRTLVYWSEQGGFDPERFDSVASTGAVDGLAEDFDLDGFEEIVVANSEGEDGRELPVQVFLGGIDGYDDADVVELPALGAVDVEAADLNLDGWTDLVVANSGSDDSSQVDSRVYWGSEQGLSAEDYSLLPTRAARGVVVHDLDADGWPDLTFANYYGLSGVSTESTIYWGSEGGFTPKDISELPTVGATGVVAGDVDLDGWPDLIFTQYTDGVSFDHTSLIYYGSSGGFSGEHSEDLEVSGPWSPAVLVGLATGGAQ
jgi:hypothetical protein